MPLRTNYHKNFVKKYARLSIAIQERFEEKHEIFMNNPFDERLKKHPLKGKMKGLWSFSVGGDIRVIYQYLSPNEVLFMRIGTHNQVYE